MMMPTSGCFRFELSFAGMQRSSANGRAVGAQETDKFIAHCTVLENFERRSAATVARVYNVNPARLARRNELDSDRSSLDGTFVPHDVHVVTARIDKGHPLCVHTGLAVG